MRAIYLLLLFSAQAMAELLPVNTYQCEGQFSVLSKDDDDYLFGEPVASRMDLRFYHSTVTNGPVVEVAGVFTLNRGYHLESMGEDESVLVNVSQEEEADFRFNRLSGELFWDYDGFHRIMHKDGLATIAYVEERFSGQCQETSVL